MRVPFSHNPRHEPLAGDIMVMMLWGTTAYGLTAAVSCQFQGPEMMRGTFKHLAKRKRSGLSGRYLGSDLRGQDVERQQPQREGTERRKLRWERRI